MIKYSGNNSEESALWKDMKLAGRFIWNHKGKCLIVFLATAVIPAGSMLAIPLVQKYRRFREEKLHIVREVITKKIEPV